MGPSCQKSNFKLMTKKCYKCGKWKDVEEFYGNKSKPDGKTCECKDCCKILRKQERLAKPELARERSKRFQERNPNYHRNTNLRLNYNLSPEQYDAILTSQNGVCAICELSCSSGRRLAVDHCHSTGVIRGLLCTNCNTGLGRYQDSSKLLRRAAQYLDTAARLGKKN